mgnify:CR=1 FL=1
MDGWEETCKRCGLCCFEKSADRSGRLQITRVPCRHLDIVSRECRVYHKRLEVGEGCVKLTPDIVRQVDWLPESCAYREYTERVARDAVREKS